MAEQLNPVVIVALREYTAAQAELQSACLQRTANADATDTAMERVGAAVETRDIATISSRIGEWTRQQHAANETECDMTAAITAFRTATENLVRALIDQIHSNPPSDN